MKFEHNNKTYILDEQGAKDAGFLKEVTSATIEITSDEAAVLKHI